jgi:hypothetical protein
MSYTPAKTGFSRVFLIEGRARPDHVPDYQDCMKAGAAEQSFGDVEKIECPSADEYNQYIEIGEIQGAEDRATTTLTGRYASDIASALLRLAKKRCDVDLQVHFGACTDPRDFNTFTKSIMFEKARLTNWSAEDLGALGSDENAKIDESADISAREIYEVLPLTFAEVCGSVVTNPVLDIVICDTPSCGDCNVESNGCQNVFALTQQSVGSPGTVADVIWTRGLFQGTGSGGCNSDNIDTLAVNQDANALACVGDYVVVISNASDSIHYKTKTDIWAAVAGGWAEVATGIVAAGSPTDIWSVGTYAFIVGDGGYVYGTEDPTAGVAVLDAGVATSEGLNAVHAISENFAVAVGDNDAVIFTENGTTWDTPSATPGSTGNLLCVWAKNENEWWVGDSVGDLYYTLDKGETWTEKGIPGANYDSINDIAFSTDSVGYIAANTSTSRGRILRTFADGGGAGGTGGWVILPEGVQNLPLADDIYSVAACKHDPNLVIGGGLADNGTDGILMVGQD